MDRRPHIALILRANGPSCYKPSTPNQILTMAVLRERPYVQFNFLVDLGTGNTDGPEAGFQECSNIGMEVTVAEIVMAMKRRTASAKSPA